MLGVQADAVQTISIEELKAHLTPALLAQLGLDDSFAELLDHDRAAAIKALEAAYRKKIAAMAEGGSHAIVAQADMPHDAHAHAHDAAAVDGDDVSLFSMLSGDLPILPLALLAGIAAGGVYIGSKDISTSNLAPTAAPDSVTTNEDTAVTFDVRTNDTDANKGDVLTVTQINGVNITTSTPVVIAGVGTVSLGTDGRLTFTPALNYNGSPQFSYTLSDGNGHTGLGVVSVTVNPVNDAPVAVNDAVTTAEDTAVTFDVRTNDSDVDGDARTVTAINGTAITTSNPVAITGGSISLGTDGRLTFTPTADFNGTPSFTYTTSDGKGGTATATVALTVTAVNDAPVNTVPTAALGATGGVQVGVAGLSVADVDSSALTTTVSVVGGSLGIIGTVTGGATVAGAGTNTLVLTGTAAQINASLAALGYTAGGTVVGSTALTITTSDGVLTDTDTMTLNVVQVVSGVAQDGYIAGATVFIDIDGDGVLDSNEPFTTTNADGTFAFTTSVTGTIVVIGGTNTDTNLPNVVTLKAPMGSTVINPITTLVAELVNSGMNLGAAKAAVATALGVPSGVDVTNYDFLAPGNNPATALEVQKIAVQIANVLTSASQAAGGGASGAAVQIEVLNHIAAAIANGTSLDLTDVSTVQTILTGTGLTDTQVTSASVQTAAVNGAVENATSPTDIAETVQESGGGTFDPTVLSVSQDTLATVVSHAVEYHNSGITTLDVVGDTLSLDATQAGTLVTAGLHFADQDSITLTPATGEGTHLSTSLKGLQDLHVDTVVAVGGAIALDAGSGLAGISASGLPHFVGVGQADPSVTLNVTGGALGSVSASDLLSLSQSLAAAGVDHIGVNGAGLSLNEAQAHAIVDGGLDILPGADVTLLTTGTAVHADLADPSTLLVPASIDHIDLDNSINNGAITLSDAEAGQLVGLGIDFAQDDTVTVDGPAAGTHLSTSLQGLQGLHVDTVVVHGNTLVVDAGGGLGALSSTDLPHFVGEPGTNPAALDVTLNVNGGTLEPGVALGGLAGALAGAGIDHIGATRPISIDYAQAEALHGAGLDFTDASDVTVRIAETDNVTLGDLAALHVDHIDWQGTTLDISDEDAAGAIAAGLDVVESDDVVVHTQGTHAATTLQGLSELHVDTIAISGIGITGEHQLVIDGGASLSTLAAETLPHFVADDGSNPDVTVNVGGAAFDPTIDYDAIGGKLSEAGVDHIGAANGVTLSFDQAVALNDHGVNFTAASDVTLNVGANDLSQIVGDPFGAAGFGVDHLHVGAPVVLSDFDASQMVAAGLDFVDSDAVSVHASGTHLSSSLRDLQLLHVDTVGVDTGVNQLHLYAGDLSVISASGLPQFDTEQSDASLSVTLRVDAAQLNELDRLGGALRQAGVDHFGLDQPLTSYDAATLAHMQAITTTTGIDFVYDPAPPATVMSFADFSLEAVDGDHGLVQQIIAAFDEAHDHGTGGDVTVQDDVVPALAESGALRAYTADTLVVDGTHAGDQLLTTLKDIADLGVDKVLVSNTGGPAFVDIGSFTGDELAEVKDLFHVLSENVHGSIFEGNAHVALVVDESIAHAIAQVDGGMEKLAALGFTEVDVLMESGSTTPPIATTAVEVKLIGQDDDLYKHLHHDG